MKQNDIIKQLDVAFKDRATKPSECISFENEKSFFIDDNESIGFCVIQKGNEEHLDTSRLFRIINSQNENIALWAVDGCFILKGKSPEHCDCIIFNNKDFCFAEFKFNSTSTNLQTIKENREKAINQLRSMILMIEHRFKKMNFNYLGYNLEAYLCTPETYPSKNTAVSDFAVEFVENYGVRLYEENKKNFTIPQHNEKQYTAITG